MNKPILELQGARAIVDKDTLSGTTIFKGLSLEVNEGGFITITGTNGAGKSTLFSVTGGNLHADEGKTLYNGQDTINIIEKQRAASLSRVSQDPKLGMAARMIVAENILLTTKHDERRYLIPRGLKSNMDRFTKPAATMGNGLENRMSTATGALSGGQRQALSFLMAIIKRPDIILLGKHIAALNPHTGLNLLHATNERVAKDHLTTLMITHNLKDALEYGNHLIVLKNGKIKADFNTERRKSLAPKELRTYFEG